MIYSKKYIEYDFTFLKEITELIMENLSRLNDGLSRCNTKEVKHCARNFCRSKISLALIGNGSLIIHAEQIVEILKAKSITEVDPIFIDSFQQICSQELKRLNARIEYYESFISHTPNLD
jgi:deoxyxylulose-5-phosphate synthase